MNYTEFYCKNVTMNDWKGFPFFFLRERVDGGNVYVRMKGVGVGGFFLGLTSQRWLMMRKWNGVFTKTRDPD